MPPTPAVTQLMGAYFHQDWGEEAADSDGVVDLFMRDEPTLASCLPVEIDAVLRSLPSEEQLKSYLVDELGGNYLADVDGGTYRGWLLGIADRVRRATAG